MSNKVATKSKAAEAMEAAITLAAALMGGTIAMRKAGQTYLPKWPGERDDAYMKRLAQATLYPAYSRTVKTLTGKPFSKPLVYEKNVPARIREWCESDVDLQGRNLDAFAADVLQEALALGMSGILVDFPPVDATVVKTVADEKLGGYRPYMVQIHPQQLLGWRAQRVAGAWVFTQLRIMETVTEDDGDFGERVIEQVRVLEPGTWAIWRKTNTPGKGEEWAQFASGTTTLKRIPFVPIYGERLAFMESVPPMLEMAHLNVEHYQSSSDQQTILHVARVPILVATGAGEIELTVGAATAVELKSGATLTFCEHSGNAIAAGKASIEALEERMRQAGAELLVLSPGNITATQVGTENAVGMCALQRIVQGTQDGLNLANQYMAEWVNEAEGGDIKLFNDFGAASLAEASAQLLLSMNQASKLSDETLHAEFQRRGILAADVDWTTEKSRIEAQGPADGGLDGNSDNLPGDNTPWGRTNTNPGTSKPGDPANPDKP